MEDVKKFFKETDNTFTIYVVEQRFVVGRGSDYFRQYKGKENYIDTNSVMKSRLFRILQGISTKIPNAAELIKACFNITKPVGIIDVIGSLFKVFTCQEHQAAGPDVFDPIIIQEGEILPKYVNQIVALHKTSILRPAIIILLKDNDFKRARTLLSGCPHNTNIKMIRNSGETEIYKVVNCGAENVDEFMDAFTHQCFSTCSNTRRDILYNEEWAEKSLIKLYSPSILQMRTNFLYQDKSLVRDKLCTLINEIDQKEVLGEFDCMLKQSFQCILRLYRVFCNDGGKSDMSEALQLAKQLDNDILLAHVYRYAYFLEGYTYDQKIELLNEAYNIFVHNGMEDNAIYCKNNKLVRQFDTSTVDIKEFRTLQEEAIYNVPGLVGMSHILNNTGVAHLMNGYPDEAIPFFDKGLDYAYRPERCIQKVAILCNRLIARAYCFDKIEEDELLKVMNLIFDNKELMNIPFISARYAMNIVVLALSKSKDFGVFLIQKYPVINLVQRAFNDNILGAGQLMLQLDLIEMQYNLQILNTLNLPNQHIQTTGVKKEFLTKTGLNPFIFSTWF